jgi:hypothetical protein
VRGPVQLALRVSSTSVTVITPGAGCSITSTATVSTTGVTGRFTFRATFFTDTRLGLALATVGFVAFGALAALRALAAHRGRLHERSAHTRLFEMGRRQIPAPEA